LSKFWLGLITGIIIIVIVGYCYVRFGFINPRADIPVSSLESRIAMTSLDAAVDRRAAEVKNSVDASDANLLHGMKIYQANCASCHGDAHQIRVMLADALYPRPPQFLEDAPDMSANQNFYIIQHGIRFSGMPAWKQSLSEQEMWQVTTFLSHINKLPPHIFEQWKVDASGSGNKAAPAEPSTENRPSMPPM
jgi:mono/diheme cytochrome c family protein